MEDNATAPPMKPDDIAASVRATIDIARLHAGKPRPAREAQARIYAPQFAETYPKFFALCANATTPEAAKTAQTLSAIMIGQLRQMDDNASSFEAASSNVGRILHDHYVKPLGLAKEKENND
jgi:hypothetical protein